MSGDPLFGTLTELAPSEATAGTTAEISPLEPSSGTTAHVNEPAPLSAQEIETALQALQGDLLALQADIAAKEGQYASLQGDLSALQSREGELSTELSAIAAAIQEAESSTPATERMTLLLDAFEGGLDGSLWNVVQPFGESSVTVRNGRAEFVNRGTLMSRQRFVPTEAAPLHIEGDWTFLAGSGARNDFLQVLTRSDGVPGGSYGETRNGVECYASPFGEMAIILRKDGQGQALAHTLVPLEIGRVYRFEIADTGSAVTFTVQDAATGAATTISAEASAQFSENRVVIHNREYNNGGATLSTLDNVQFWTEQEVAGSGATPEALLQQQEALQSEEAALLLQIQNIEQQLQALQRDFQDLAIVQWSLEEQIGALSQQLAEARASLADAGAVSLTEEITQAIQEETQTMVMEEERRTADAERPAIPYARIFVTTQEQEHRTDVSVRYRSPGDSSYLEVRSGERVIQSAVLSHPGGTADSTHMFFIDRTQPNATHFDGGFEITLWDSPEKRQVLDRVEGSMRPSQNRVSISTTQPAWEYLEAGRIAENPLAPDLRVAKIEGPNVLLAIQSPFDESSVGIDGGGMLSSRSITHEGGTAESLVELTINGKLKTGDYTINFSSRSLPLDSVLVHWDKEQKTLTLAHPETEGIPEYGTPAIQSIDISHQGLANLQKLHLYETSSLFVSVEQMLQGLQKRYPPSLSQKSYNESANSQTENLGGYEQRVADLLHEAMNIFVKIRQGEDEGPLLQHLEKSIQVATSLRKIQELAIMTGVVIPSREALLAAAKEVLEKNMDFLLKNQVKGQQLIAKDNARASDHTWQLAQGQQDPIDSGQETVAGSVDRLAQKIARTIEQSLHPIAAAVRKSGEAQALAKKIAAEVASHGSAPEQTDIIVSSTLVAMAGQLDVGGVGASASITGNSTNLHFGNTITEWLEKNKIPKQSGPTFGAQLESHLIQLNGGIAFPTWDEVTDQNIAQLHPAIRLDASVFVNAVERELGIRLRVYESLRTIEQQDALYAIGRTQTGSVVTNAQGGESYHNYGLAFDLVEVQSDGILNWDTDWEPIARLGRQLGFEWGGDWENFPDRPHWQMIFGLSIADLQELYRSLRAEERYVPIP